MNGEKNYIYDSTVKNKPWNSNALYLNINTFKEKQNNMTNAEAQLVLDNNTIRALNDVNGTLCINRLIQNWRNVSGAGDMFRNLGVNNLDAALTKEQKSIVEIDQANAGFSMQPMAPQKFKILTNNAIDVSRSKSGKTQRYICINSPYFTINRFGGDHTDNGAGRKEFCLVDNNFMTYLSAAFKIYRELADNQDKSLYDYLMKKRTNWKKWDENGNYVSLDENSIFWDDEKLGVYYFLNRMDSGDIAAANIIFDQLQFISDEAFSKSFHFSRRGEDGNLNYRLLAADYREEYESVVSSYDAGAIDNLIQGKANKYKYDIDSFNEKYPNHRLLNSDGSFTQDALNLFRKEVIDDIENRKSYSLPDNSGFVNIDGSPRAKGTLSLLNKLSSYVDKAGYNLNARSLSKSGIVPDENVILDALEKGESITFSAKNFQLKYAGIDNKEDIKISDQEQLVIAGIVYDKKENDYKYVVSYKGERWFFDPKVNSTYGSMSDFYAIEISPKDGQIRHITGANPFIGSGIWEGAYKDSKGKIIYPLYEKICEFAKKHPGYEECDDVKDNKTSELTVVLNVLAKRGSFDLNRLDVLAAAYDGKEKQFYEKYGFDLYDDDRNLNEDLLMVDFYLKYGNVMSIDFDTAEGKECYVDYLENYYKDNSEDCKKNLGHSAYDVPPEQLKKECETIFEGIKEDYKRKGMSVVTFHLSGKEKYYYTETKESLNAKFKQYCEEHGDNVTIKPLNVISKQERMTQLFKNNPKPSFEERRDALNYDNIPTAKEIIQLQKNGYNVIFECSDPYYLEDENGNIGIIGEDEVLSKEMRILEVVNIKGRDGITREKYRVLCNGKEYYYDPIMHSKDCSNYFAIKMGSGAKG